MLSVKLVSGVVRSHACYMQQYNQMLLEIHTFLYNWTSLRLSEIQYFPPDV